MWALSPRCQTMMMIDPKNDSDDSGGEAIYHAIKFIEKIDKKFTD